jgi:DNA-binding MarR family transcriptional regulator
MEPAPIDGDRSDGGDLTGSDGGAPSGGYVLEENVGFILRQVTQRHLALFAAMMCEDLTPTQFSAIVKLHEHGSCSQNRLGRLTSVDNPTIKGVVDRLVRRGIVATGEDPQDARLLVLSLTDEGGRIARAAIPCAKRITAATLAPLSPDQQAQLLTLLKELR